MTLQRNFALPSVVLTYALVQTHDFEHACYERKFTWRPDALRSTASVDLDGAAMMQTFETDDHVVFVWTVSFDANGFGAPPHPFFRASGWMVFRISHDGTVSCRSCARVHSAPLASGGRSGKSVERESVVNAWAETLQTKQRNMWNRLLLVV